MRPGGGHRLRHQLDPAADRRPGRGPAARRAPRDAHRAAGPRCRRHRTIRARRAGAHPCRADRLRRPAGPLRRAPRCGWWRPRRPAMRPTATCSSHDRRRAGAGGPRRGRRGDQRTSRRPSCPSTVRSANWIRPTAPFVVVDLGGGSTEVVLGNGPRRGRGAGQLLRRHRLCAADRALPALRSADRRRGGRRPRGGARASRRGAASGSRRARQDVGRRRRDVHHHRRAGAEHDDLRLGCDPPVAGVVSASCCRCASS